MNSEEQQGHNRIWQEIDRLRNRVHNLESTVKGLDILTKRAMEQLDEIEKTVHHIDNEVEHLQKADAIADGIATRLAQNRDSKWRIWGVRTAIVSAITAGGTSIIELVIKLR